MSLSNRDCIEQCQNGHPEAFRHLVKRYQAVLWAHLTGCLGNREWAEEAAQETMVRAYFALDKLKNRDSFFSWLLGIANRVAYEQERTRRRQQETARALAQRPQPDPFSEHPALEQAVSKLPEHYRQVVLLRHYGQRSCAEVAGELGIPLGTVTKQLSRAYAKLRDALHETDLCEDRSEARS